MRCHAPFSSRGVPTYAPLSVVSVRQALAVLDRNETTTPEIGSGEEDQRRKFHANMLPHVIRGHGDPALGRLFTPTVMRTNGAAATGVGKKLSGSDYVDNYFGTPAPVSRLDCLHLTLVLLPLALWCGRRRESRPCPGSVSGGQ
jgi:hypothetical protein